MAAGAQFDVAVVGAGPAGSIAAFTLARSGASVLLLEREKIPRDKVCGDGLLPDAITLLSEIGLWDRVRRSCHAMATARMYAPNGTWTDLSGTFCTIRRRQLDEILARAAEEAGAELRTNVAVTGFRVEEGYSVITTAPGAEEGEIRARLAILTSGANARLLKRFGLSDMLHPSACAMRTYFRLRDGVDDSRLRIWFERHTLPGYGWTFPMGEGVFNVGVGVISEAVWRGKNLWEILARFTTDCEDACQMLAGSTQLGPFKGAPLRTGLEGASPSGERLLACGEAIGATYPMTGEGIGKAMQTAKLAAEVAIGALATDRLGAEHLNRYDELLEERFRAPFRHYALAERWTCWPWVMNLVARKARSGGRVRTLFEQILAEENPPTEIFSAAGLLKALLLP